MKRLYSILGAIAIAATLAGIGSTQMASSAKAPTRHQVVVSEDVLNPLIGEPEHDFHQAASLFTQGDHQGAASEIRASAALLSLEAGRGGAENRSGLSSSSAELDDLAARVERGDVSSRSELNLTFARADLALAAHYRGMADKALANKEHDKRRPLAQGCRRFGRRRSRLGRARASNGAGSGSGPGTCARGQDPEWHQLELRRSKEGCRLSWQPDPVPRGSDADAGQLADERQRREMRFHR